MFAGFILLFTLGAIIDLLIEIHSRSIIPQLQIEGRIVGGNPIDITVAPYQVSITLNDTHICGGSIIGEQWVLTAAHCVTEYDPLKRSSLRFYGVRTSSSQINNGTNFTVDKIIIHEKFNSISALNYDYALIELSDKLAFNDMQSPIELTDKIGRIDVGSLCLVTGFGETLNNSDDPRLLRAVSVPIVNQIKCAEVYGAALTDAMICAGYDEGGKGFCQRDSGGPLVYNDRLFGIVSWSNKCAEPKSPGVYARVSTARDWIKHHSGI